MSDNVIDMQMFKDGDFKLHILNENNIPITKEYIEGVLKKYGLIHKVQNLELFQTAMIHISYMNRTSITEKTARILKDIPPIEDPSKAMELQKTCYGRLEYLGDAIIHHAIAEYLFMRYENEGEGFLTKIRTKLEKAESLSELSKKIGLPKYAIIARNVEFAGGRISNVHLTEDIFESFFGALSMEVSYDKCKDLFINIIEKEVDIAELIYNDDNYKDRLMQYFHKIKWAVPKYYENIVSTESTSPESRIFTMHVKNQSGDIIGIGTGSSKSKAEQNAAKSALITLGVIKEKEEENDNDYYGEMSEESENEYDRKETKETKKNKQTKVKKEIKKKSVKIEESDDYFGVLSE